MRDNGLPAQAWTHVADLDPWLADAALDALRRAGVAAYITPHPGRPGAYLDVQLPDRPTDRLYVESGARERAAMVLAHLDQETHDGQVAGHAASAAEVDAAFAEIVARYETTDDAGDDLAKEPTAEPSAEPSAEPAAEPGGRVVREAVGWDDLFRDDHLRVPAAEDASDPDAERYLPPPPPPVPHGTPLRRFAWAAVIGAPLLVVACVLLSYQLRGWIGLVVVGAFVGGLITLFATLDDRQDEDDPDDGAVV